MLIPPPEEPPVVCWLLHATTPTTSPIKARFRRSGSGLFIGHLNVCLSVSGGAQSRSRCTLVTGPDGEVHYKPGRGDVPRTLHNARP
jgi:hypothetical protein